MLLHCRWFGPSSAGREPAGGLSAAGSGPESDPSSADVAGSDSGNEHAGRPITCTAKAIKSLAVRSGRKSTVTEIRYFLACNSSVVR